MVVHKRKLSFLGTILFGLALCTFPVNAQEVSSSQQPFESQVSSVQSASASSVSSVPSTVESSASSLSSSSESTSEQNTVSSASSSESGNSSSDLGGTASSTASLQTVTPPVSDGWVTENGAVYYYKNKEKQKGWLQLDGKQYYLDSKTGVRKTKELFQTEKGFSYAQADGTILSGGKKKGDDGNLYLVSSDGILRNPGLLITPDYDGYWAPYYIDPTTHAVKTGLFSVNGTYYYGREDKGYLVCGKYKAPDGNTYLANSAGTLKNPGLLVTPDYDGYWAPYYIDPTTHAVKTGLFSVNGTYYYGREDKGYLVCGKYKAPDGNTYLANSAGTLRNPGLLVTPDYDGYWAPYYIDAQTHAVKTGLFNVNSTYYYGREDEGYLVCGKYKAPNGNFYLANSDGKLLTQTGWLETSQYDGVTERYYLENPTGNYSTVKTGFFDLDGYSYYGIPDEGHVLRGKKVISGQMFLAGQDGHLQTTTGWLITSEYDNGTLQRYYLNDSAVSGHPGAVMGAFTADGKKYYGREDTGYEVRGTYRAPSGTIYYADNDGVLMDVPPEIAEMEARAQGYSSDTNYLILVNTSVHKVSVFYGWSGNWNRLYTWDCANGAQGTPTITGEFSTSSKGYYFDSGSARCFYYTQFYEDFLFHSTLYYQYPTPDYPMDDRVGMALSHGCVRLRLENAKWIYDNIPYGTKVVAD